MRLHNRWFQLVASLIAMIMIANLQVLVDAVRQAAAGGTGWKLSDIQFAFTLFILCQTWIQPLDGWLIDRLGPRGFISAAGLLCGLGWAGWLRHHAADAVRVLLRGRRRRRIRLQRVDRVGAEMVQGPSAGWRPASWPRVRRRHGAVHPDHLVDDCVARLSDGVHLDRHLPGSGDRPGRAVPETSAGRSLRRAGEIRRWQRIAARPPALHHRGDDADAAVLHDVRDVRADVDRRAAGHGARRVRSRRRGATAPPR